MTTMALLSALLLLLISTATADSLGESPKRLPKVPPTPPDHPHSAVQPGIADHIMPHDEYRGDNVTKLGTIHTGVHSHNTTLDRTWSKGAMLYYTVRRVCSNTPLCSTSGMVTTSLVAVNTSTQAVTFTLPLFTSTTSWDLEDVKASEDGYLALIVSGASGAMFLQGLSPSGQWLYNTSVVSANGGGSGFSSSVQLSPILDPHVGIYTVFSNFGQGESYAFNVTTGVLSTPQPWWILAVADFYIPGSTTAKSQEDARDDELFLYHYPDSNSVTMLNWKTNETILIFESETRYMGQDSRFYYVLKRSVFAPTLMLYSRTTKRSAYNVTLPDYRSYKEVTPGLSGDGRRLALRTDNYLVIVDAISGQIIRTAELGNPVIVADHGLGTWDSSHGSTEQRFSLYSWPGGELIKPEQVSSWGPQTRYDQLGYSNLVMGSLIRRGSRSGGNNAQTIRSIRTGETVFQSTAQLATQLPSAKRLVLQYNASVVELYEFY